MKKKVVLFIGIAIVIVVVLLVIFLGDKHLDLKSDEITTLYRYLGEVDVNRCGGLNQYTGEEVTYDTISNANKMCLAYYEINKDQITNETSDVTTTNDNDIDICEIGEGTRFVAVEGEEYCNYDAFAKSDLEEAYRKIYGHDLPDDSEFYISSTDACYLDGESYYCGEAETFVQSLTPEATVYRLMDKAVEKMNGDIVISDYYLKVSGNKCYSSNSFDNEVTTCTQELEDHEDLEIDAQFVQKYGVLYEHTFKMDDQGNYYWYSSNVK